MVDPLSQNTMLRVIPGGALDKIEARQLQDKRKAEEELKLSQVATEQPKRLV